METPFDSFSSSSKDPLIGPSSFLSLPSPTLSIQPIPTLSCVQQPSLSRRIPLRRSSVTFHTSKDHRQAALQGRSQAPHYTVLQSGYPSPPHTGSQFDHSLTPTTSQDNGFPPFFAKFEAGGILDSPVVMRREEFCSPEKPLSPPLTLPLSTLSLPETESELSADHDNYSRLSPTSHEDNIPSHVAVRKDTLSDENEDTFSDLLQSEGMDLFQLSSLSPAWMSESPVGSENSTLLGSSPIASRPGCKSLGKTRAESSNYNRVGSYRTLGFNSSPPWSPQSADVMLPQGPDVNTERGMQSDEFCSISDFDSYQPTRFPLLSTEERNEVSPFEQCHSSGLGSLPTPVSPKKANLSSEGGLEPSHFWSPDISPSCPRPSHACGRPYLPRLSIPESSHHTPGSPIINISGLFDDDYSMNVDNEKKPQLPLLYDADDAFFLPTPSSFAEPLPPPSSPSISTLDLPDLIDEESPPSSPSRRSLRSLPDLELGDPPDTDFHPASPTPSLLTFPGADTDDDLLPPPSPNFSTSSPPPLTSSHSLLFIDDPRDVPLPRSPSPEDFDLNIAIDDDSDMELMKLYSLHKKSLAAERAARYAETQLIDAGSIVLRAEAAREKKRNKQRSKELGALLRIKLGDRVTTSSPDENSSRGMISSISKLVARMIFRRNETFRPLAHRRLASAKSSRVRSPLSRSAAGDLSEEDF